MSKFIKVEAIDFTPGLDPIISEIILNVDDISYIEGVTVRMKSLAVRAKDYWEKEDRKTKVLKTNRHFE